MATHNEIGKSGEKLACEWIASRGYTLLHKNWRSGRREVDIIAAKCNCLHFIEVKTNTTLQFGYPEQRVSTRKMQHLLRAAEEFLALNPGWAQIQFDTLSILLKPAQIPLIHYFEDIYPFPPDR
ncbi:MAG: YraN family protein [Chitinophagaceae bacterium]